MNTTVIVVIVLAVLVIAVIAGLVVRAASARRELKERFGAEYDRAIDEHGGRSAAEAELRRRERAHDEFDLKDLTPEEIAQYRAAWIELQVQFVDDPKAAVRAADQLVSKFGSDRGYPVAEFDERVVQLSVEHAAVLSAYRDAHGIAVRSDSDTASTEDLRQAMMLYRELIADLLGDPTLNEPSPTVPTVAEPTVADSTIAEPTIAEPTASALDVAEPVVTDTGTDADTESEPGSGTIPVNTSSAVPATTSTAIPSTIPTADGQPPTAADLSANEGYVAADAESVRNDPDPAASDVDPVEPPYAVVPDDARDLATDVSDVTSTQTSPARGLGSRASTRTNSE